MLLRKINAGLSLLTALLLMDHALFYTVRMLSGGQIAASGPTMPRMLATLMLLHALLCIVLAVRGHRGAEKRKCKSYPRLNLAAFLQRTTGILLLLLVGLHAAGAASDFRPVLLHALFEPLFFAAALAHVSVSVGRALITLGIGSAAVIRTVDRVMRVLCAATMLAATAGFYFCLFTGGAA